MLVVHIVTKLSAIAIAFLHMNTANADKTHMLFKQIQVKTLLLNIFGHCTAETKALIKMCSDLPRFSLDILNMLL